MMWIVTGAVAFLAVAGVVVLLLAILFPPGGAEPAPGAEHAELAPDASPTIEEQTRVRDAMAALYMAVEQEGRRAQEAHSHSVIARHNLKATIAEGMNRLESVPSENAAAAFTSDIREPELEMEERI